MKTEPKKTSMPLKTTSHFSHPSLPGSQFSRFPSQKKSVQNPSFKLYHPQNLYRQDPLYGGWNTSFSSPSYDFDAKLHSDYYEYAYEDSENDRDYYDAYYEYNDDNEHYSVPQHHYSNTRSGDAQVASKPDITVGNMQHKIPATPPTVLTYANQEPRYHSKSPTRITPSTKSSPKYSTASPQYASISTQFRTKPPLFSSPAHQHITEKTRPIQRRHPTENNIDQIVHNNAITKVKPTRHSTADALYPHVTRVTPNQFTEAVDSVTASPVKGLSSPLETFTVSNPFKKPAITFYSSEEMDPETVNDYVADNSPNNHQSPFTKEHQKVEYNDQFPLKVLNNQNMNYNQYWANDDHASYFTNPYFFSANPFINSKSASGPNVAGLGSLGSTSGNLTPTRGHYFSPMVDVEKSAYFPQEILRQYYLDSFTYFANLRRNNSLAQIYKENPYTRRFLGITPRYMTTAGPNPPKPRITFEAQHEGKTNLHFHEIHEKNRNNALQHHANIPIKDLLVQTSTQIPKYMHTELHLASDSKLVSHNSLPITTNTS